MERSNIRSFKYDFAISYASEEEHYAEELYKELTEMGLRVFYAPTEPVRMWGKNLVEYLTDIYNKQAVFCIPLVSTNYVRKAWTRLEWRSAQDRALKQIDTEYILPIRIDETEMPGLLDSTNYLNITEGIEKIADIAREWGIWCSYKFHHMSWIVRILRLVELTGVPSINKQFNGIA